MTLRVMDYKATLNLPKTAFPMKANLPKSEPEMLKFRNFGRKSLKEIQDILGEMGLAFGMDIGRFYEHKSPIGVES